MRIVRLANQQQNWNLSRKGIHCGKSQETERTYLTIVQLLQQLHTHIIYSQVLLNLSKQSPIKIDNLIVEVYQLFNYNKIVDHLINR